jgi:hypothetical protein
MAFKSSSAPLALALGFVGYEPIYFGALCPVAHRRAHFNASRIAFGTTLTTLLMRRPSDAVRQQAWRARGTRSAASWVMLSVG